MLPRWAAGALLVATPGLRRWPAAPKKESPNGISDRTPIGAACWSKPEPDAAPPIARSEMVVGRNAEFPNKGVGWRISTTEKRGRRRPNAKAPTKGLERGV